jgi:hypothetical protein
MKRSEGTDTPSVRRPDGAAYLPDSSYKQPRIVVKLLLDKYLLRTGSYTPYLASLDSERNFDTYQGCDPFVNFSSIM